MAENTRLTGIELNGQLYSLGKTIYEELDMSLERFAELLGRDLYCPTLRSAPTSSTLTYTDTDGETHHFQTGQPCRWAEGDDYRIAVCKDITLTASSWYLLPTKVSELTNDSEYAKSDELSAVATSGSYNDLSNKPTIPSAVTESTVSEWGFTKNTGTVTGVKMNGTSKGSSGVVDLGNVITGDGTILQIVKVSALPSSPVSTTLYIIPE